MGTNLGAEGGGTVAEVEELGRGRGPLSRVVPGSLATTFLGANSSSLDSSSFSTMGCHDSSILEFALGSSPTSSDSSDGNRSIGSVEGGLGFGAGEKGSGLTGRNFSLEASKPNSLVPPMNEGRAFGAEKVEGAAEERVAGEGVGRAAGGGAKSSSSPSKSIGTALVDWGDGARGSGKVEWLSALCTAATGAFHRCLPRRFGEVCDERLTSSGFEGWKDGAGETVGGKEDLVGGRRGRGGPASPVS